MKPDTTPEASVPQFEARRDINSQFGVWLVWAVGRGHEVARVRGETPEVTARQFAAAPELLEHLKWAVEWLDAYEGECMPEWREWQERATAAVAQATGWIS